MVKLSTLLLDRVVEAIVDRFFDEGLDEQLAAVETSEPAAPSPGKSGLIQVVCRGCSREFEYVPKGGPARKFCNSCRPGRLKTLKKRAKRASPLLPIATVDDFAVDPDDD